jgi:hypothetical protein
MEHAPYSPDLVPCDFFMFLKMKFSFRGPRFYQLKTFRECDHSNEKDFRKVISCDISRHGKYVGMIV